jgi:hypothetical protein
MPDNESAAAPGHVLAGETSPTVDPAALGSAAMAAVISTAVSPGRWGWLSLGVGLALALLLAGYYRPLNWPPTGRLDALFRAAAFGAIAGLLVAMILSWPIQTAVDRSGATDYCTAEEDPEDCAGGEAEGWVVLTWLVAAVGLTVAHDRIVRPRDATEPRPDRAT